MRLKDVEAVGEYVVLKFVKVNSDNDLFKKKGSIFIPNGETSNPQEKSGDKWDAFIYKIGPKVESPTFNVGDMVVFNNYDIKYVGDDDDNLFGVLQGRNVMAVITKEEEAQ